MHTQTPDGRPTIFFIIADQKRHDTNGAFGYPVVHRLDPNVEQLRRERVMTVRNDAWELVHFVDSKEGQPFDFVVDPAKTENLWGDRASAGNKRESLDTMGDWHILLVSCSDRIADSQWGERSHDNGTF